MTPQLQQAIRLLQLSRLELIEEIRKECDANPVLADEEFEPRPRATGDNAVDVAHQSNEQGELQGGLTSLMSLTAIVGPPLMANTFSYFTGPSAPFYFPGAALTLAGILTVIGTLMARASLFSSR